MSQSARSRSLLLTLLMLTSFVPAALLGTALAASEVVLSTDPTHIQLNPGEATNVTLTVHNNGTSIHTFDLEVDDSATPSCWNVTLTQSILSSVLPTQSADSTVVVRLSQDAQLGEDGSVDLIATRSGSNISTTITLLLTVNPHHLPLINISGIGDLGLLPISPGESVNVTIPVTNMGNVNDSLLLSVGDEPALAQWWDDWWNAQGGQPSPQPSGNETLTITSPTNATTYDLFTSSSLSVNWSASQLVGEVEYDVVLVIACDDNATSMWQSNHTVNVTTGGFWMNESWLSMAVGNHTLTVNITHNGSTLTALQTSFLVIDTTPVPSGQENLAINYPATGDDYSLDWWEEVPLIYQLTGLTQGLSYILEKEIIDRDDGSVVHSNANPLISAGTVQTTYDEWSGATEGNYTVWFNLSHTGNPLFSTSVDFTVSEGGRTPEGVGKWQVNASGNSVEGTFQLSASNLTNNTTYLLNQTVKRTDFIGNQTLINTTQQSFNASGLNWTLNWTHPLVPGLYSINVLSGENLSTPDSNQSVWFIVSGMYEDNATGLGRSTPPSGQNDEGGIPANLPVDWEIRWMDDLAENVLPGEQVNMTLRITVPLDTPPSYLGIRLYAGSLFGNISAYSTLVVNVTVHRELLFETVVNESSLWLPGEGGEITTNVVNHGSQSVAHIYSLADEAGPCDWTLPISDGTLLGILDEEMVGVLASPWSSSHYNDTCEATLVATPRGVSGVTHTHNLSLRIGMLRNLSISGPTVAIIEPGVTSTLNFVVHGMGTESDEFVLVVDALEGIEATPSSEWAFVGRGSATLSSVGFNVPADTNLLGNVSVNVTAVSRNDSAISASHEITLTIAPHSALTLLGPLDGRVVVEAGSSGNVTLTLRNDGTDTGDYRLSWNNLPLGVEMGLNGGDTSNIVLNSSSSVELTLLVVVSGNAESGEAQLSITATDNDDIGLTSTISVQLVITDRAKLLVSAESERVVVGSQQWVNHSVLVFNLGNREDTFTASLSDDPSRETSLTPSILTLPAGDSGVIMVRMRQIAAPPLENTFYQLEIRSSIDPSVVAAHHFTVVRQSTAAQLIIVADHVNADPGESLFGTIHVRNDGNAWDSFQLSSHPYPCTFTNDQTGNQIGVVELTASSSSDAIRFACTIPTHTEAGFSNLTFKARSLSDPSLLVEKEYTHTVKMVRGSGDQLLTIGIGSSETIRINYEGQAILTIEVTNVANGRQSGLLMMAGDGTNLVAASWRILPGGGGIAVYDLEVGESVTIELTLDSLTDRGGDALLHIEAMDDSTGEVSRSDGFILSIEGKHSPPTGLALPFGLELDNQQGLTVLTVGWLVGILALSLVIIFIRGSKRIDDVVSEVEQSSPPPSQPIPEPDTEVCMMEVSREAGGLVTCLQCEARLRVPGARTPPYRFKCPECESTLRVIA